MRIRKANLLDKKEIWEWWNDPVTRQMMKQNNYVSWEEHTIWYENIMVGADKILLIAETNIDKIGVIRFDLKNNSIYEVSINLNPNFRKKGYGSKVLKLAIKFLKDKNIMITKLFAVYKKMNIASKKIFFKSNFIVKKPKDITILNKFESNKEEYCELEKF
jgi:RimJ/RimL family protein N-acetyltransferase